MFASISTFFNNISPKMGPQKDVPTIDSLHIYLELLWYSTNLQGFFSYEVSNLVRKVFLSSLTWAREEWRGIHQ